MPCEDNGTLKVQHPGEGPTEWAKSFEKLLDCPAGLHAFAQFLRKEFSAENIYFWTACEKYRKLTSTPAEIAAEAERIYRKYLQAGAPEAVNVDAHARQYADECLKNATSDMFVQAQQQIFNLMKFDSYSRFLKSQIYENCLHGKEDRYAIDADLMLQPQHTKLKKSVSNAEDRRRKSLLPWHRKNRSKSKDRTDLNNRDVNENVRNTEMHNSRTSLTSLDISVQSSIVNNNDLLKANNELIASGRNPLCRVKLMDGNTTVSQLKPSETVNDLVLRLLEKRGITYTAFVVHTNKHSKPVNVNENSYVLAGCEVEIEQRVCFKLDLPNKKVIAVKSKPSKTLIDVLRPILEKYSFKLEQVLVLCNNECVDLLLPVTSVSEQRLNVLLKCQNSLSEPMAATLEEITNKVYEDILHEKCDHKLKTADSIKSDDWGSEYSSSLVGRFLKRDSDRNNDRKKKLSNRSKTNSTRSSVEDLVNDFCGDENNSGSKGPLIAKLTVGAKVHNTSESEELYEGLNRAQRCRLDDQRGTKIDCAMPDFLKDSISCSSTESSAIHVPCRRISSPRSGEFCNYENRNLLELGLSKNNFKMYKSDSTRLNTEVKCRPPLDLKNGVINRMEPPPLPPKPKVVPTKPSNWRPREDLRTMRKECNKELFLEQTTSSFV